MRIKALVKWFYEYRTITTHKTALYFGEGCIKVDAVNISATLGTLQDCYHAKLLNPFYVKSNLKNLSTYLHRFNNTKV